MLREDSVTIEGNNRGEPQKVLEGLKVFEDRERIPCLIIPDAVMPLLRGAG
jgi:hypothetical protein